jgi:hypothetical protein
MYANQLIMDKLITIEPTESDLALEAFRKNFPLVKVNVWPEGNGMTYTLHRKSIADSFLKDAERIIETFQLPLVACTYKTLLFATLVIEYKSEGTQRKAICISDDWSFGDEGLDHPEVNEEVTITGEKTFGPYEYYRLKGYPGYYVKSNFSIRNPIPQSI